MFPADAQDRAAELTGRISKERAELERLRSEIEQQKKRRKEMTQRERSVLDQLQDMDHRLALKRKELSVLNLQLKKRDAEIRELGRQADGLQDRLSEKTSQIKKRVRRLYQERPPGSYLQVVFSEDPTTSLRKLHYLFHLSKQEQILLSSIKETLARLSKTESRLKLARAELLRDQSSVAQAVQTVQSEKHQKSGLLKRVRLEKEFYTETIRELEESAGRLQALIKRLEEQRRQARKPPAIPKGPFAQFKGKLDWPTHGVLVAKFGRQKHPQFGTTILKRGIEIKADKTKEIRAVHHGTVAFADWFKGYGLLLILDHGDDYYTLYAHASKLLVSVGEKVKTGQVVGEVGDTGLTEEDSLYFELRHGTEPLDPLQWLKHLG
jgi:septal ring factor EnvC (AmiA/AmiB activator)